jgi:hypothetical protein
LPEEKIHTGEQLKKIITDKKMLNEDQRMTMASRLND